MVEAPQPERLEQLAQVLVPQEVVRRGWSSYLRSRWCLCWCPCGRVAGWKCIDNSGWQDKFDTAFDCNGNFAWPIYMVSLYNVITIPYLSSLQYSSIKLGARGVVDPDSLSPFGHVGEVGFVSIKALVGC